MTVASGLSRPYFFRSAGVGVVGDDRLHLHRLQPSDQAFDRSEVGLASATGFVIFQSPPSFAIASVLPPAVTSSAVDLVALELQQRLVAQVERRTC